MQRPDPERAKIHAVEAQSLANDPAFQRAVLAAEQRCFKKLATADPLDTELIRTVQADIHAIHLLSEMLGDEIILGAERRAIAVA